MELRLFTIRLIFKNKLWMVYLSFNLVFFESGILLENDKMRRT